MNARFPLRLGALAALLLSLAAGCSRAAEPPSTHIASAATAPATGSPASLPNASRALIVTVDMGLRVKDASDATEKVRREVEGAGGYVSSSNAHGGEDEGATMDLRVPVDKTSAVRAKLRAMGDVTSESENVEDVTEQRADLAARLHNARTQEGRLLEIMQQKTGSIGDVLEAEKELARVRETVERLEAEQRTLDSKVDMATIHLSITTPASAAWQTPGKSISRSWSAGVKGAQALAVYGAMAASALAPTLVPVLGMLLLVVLLVRRARAKRAREMAMVAT